MTEPEVIELSNHGTFNGSVISGSIEETHISWVILGKRDVFKIKKPLQLDFLDFSTLPLRKKYCERELQLNRRFSDIYLGVVPVRRHNNQWFIGGSQGAIADYAVHMRRMATFKRMDKMLQKATVEPQDLAELARVIAGFHKRAEKIYTPFHVAAARQLFNNLAETEPFVSKHCGEGFSAIISRSIEWSNRFLTAHGNRLQQRIDSGHKRDLHGDLHSGNIFLYKKPVLFDCIEFNDQFRQIDVLYEVAFLCMDMEATGQKHLSDAFLAAYKKYAPAFETSEDEDVFTYFKCLRANVRAKVHTISASQADSPGELAHHTADVARYLQLMRGYVSRLP